MGLVIGYTARKREMTLKLAYIFSVAIGFHVFAMCTIDLERLYFSKFLKSIHRDIVFRL